jgi:hypothetical protein
MPETLGSVTRVVFFEEPEPGKIHIEFLASAAIKKGQQVKLAANGSVVPLADGDSAYLCIGVAVMDIADTERGTVATRGYAVIIARAAAALDAGPVEIAAYDTTNDRPVYEAASGSDHNGKAHITVGYNLDQLSAAGENKVLLI